MSYIRAWTRTRAQCYVLATIAVLFTNQTVAATPAYCSPQNVAIGGSTSSNYMSTGLCTDTCRSASMAFAVILGKDCWCSNYAPSQQDDPSRCNDQCPGYPDDTCGNVANSLYAYFTVGTSSGTAGVSSSSRKSSVSPIVPTSTPPGSLSSERPRSSRTLSFVSSVLTSDVRSQSSVETSTTSLILSAPSTRSQSQSSVSDPTQVYTSIVTVTGRVSTIIVTPTPAQTSDSALGVANSSSGGGGVSGGTVAGIVVGVAIVIGLIIGGAVFWWLRKRHRKNLDALSERGSYTSPSATGKNNGGIPSRQVSQLSSAGLLTKPSRVNTAGASTTIDDQRSAGAGTNGSDRNSTHMTVDQRLNPWAIYSNEVSRASNVSLQDNTDYSRQLRVANPDP